MNQDSVRIRHPRVEPEVQALACRLVAPDTLPATSHGEFPLATVCYAAEHAAPAAGGIRVDVPLPQLQEPLVELWTSTARPELRREGALQLALTEELLAPGTEATLEGHRSRDPDARVMKAERVIIAGTLHDLYPGRS